MENPIVAGQVEGIRLDRRTSETGVAPDKANVIGMEERGKGSKAQKNGHSKGKVDPTDPVDPGKEPCSAKTRKRTKTGCLTCRKRRIKCGEERPICSNCVKSKRNCEGYTPRVIFKDPLGAYRPEMGTAHGNGVHYQNLSSHAGLGGPSTRVQVGPASQAVLPPIAPRPSPPILQNGTAPSSAMDANGIFADQYSLFGYTFDGQTFAESDLPPRVRQQQTSQRELLYSHDQNTANEERPGQNRFQSMHHPDQPSNTVLQSGNGVDLDYPAYSSEWPHGSISSTGPSVPQLNQAQPTLSPQDDDPSPRKRLGSLPQALFPPYSDRQFPEHWLSQTHEGYEAAQWEPIQPQNNIYHYDQGTSEVHQNNISPTSPQELQGAVRDIAGHHSLDVLSNPNLYRQCTTGTQTLGSLPASLDAQQKLAHEEPEDDYWDVTSDEEMMVADQRGTKTAPGDLGLMIAMSANQHGKSFRSLTNFLGEPNVLAAYRPTYAASPLRDSQTALIFCHFITATAPTISASERHILNSAAMFSGHPVPKSQRGLWTYTMPMLALHHQGLLHAMLALASLHIAKLQKASSTPSLKHYHFALRKVAKSLGNPTKRNNIATLAATLLLGFYEVTTAEHNKWNSHLAGAKQLIMEIDFVGTTNRIKAWKRTSQANRDKRQFNGYTNGFGDPYIHQHKPWDSSESDQEPDENLISIFMGWKTRYNEYGQIIEGDGIPIPQSTKPVSQKEVDDYEAHCDLFWWYAKQDMYQSIISGNRLLLPYERWSHCPPRAPFSRLDAVYGTMDHLILLMARIADFAGKDLPRKRKIFVKKSQFPANSLNQSTPPVQPSSFYRTPPDGQFTPIPSNHTSVADDDLQSLTYTAEAEWLEISRALDVFEESLGPSFAALSPEHMPPLSTPFGPALYYRTHGIANIWTLYYCGRIISLRVHPSMPPAAMAAAGIAAQRTAHWANTIGRINGGLQPSSTTVPLHPAHGAALMDACMGLFHAGVQYRDAAQRGWTITKLRDVARMTGWQTSALIASGCERAWMKAYEDGKGPPYERTMNKTAKDDRVAGRSRDPNQGPPKDNNDRRFIHVNPGTRVYWAMGILSAEEDMRELDLGD